MTSRIARFALTVALLLVPALRASELQPAMQAVEAVRGKSFRHSVERRVMKRSELRPYLLDGIARSSSSADDYRKTLEMLQLVDHDPTLIDRMLDLYDAQVLAFYDPERHVYYALDQPPPDFPSNEMLEQMVTVHELTHALQDQLFDAGERLAAVEKDWDREAAYHAVLEGEAMLVMLGNAAGGAASLDTLLRDDTMLSAMAKAGDLTVGVPPSTPRFLVDAMKFPYLDGLRLVVAAYRKGGWKGVDALHARPPETTGEVLHPESYFERIATNAPRVRLPLDASAFFSAHLGEFFWRELVGEEAARGAEDSVVTIRRDRKQRMTVFVTSRWSSAVEARRFADAYESLLRRRGFRAQVQPAGSVVRAAYGDDRRAIARFVASR